MYHQYFPLLKERVYTSKGVRARTIPRVEHLCQRPTKYKLWSQEKMSRALNSVVKEGLSVRKAALEYNVPRATLGDRVSGKVLDGCKSGRARYLNDSEEAELVEFLVSCAKIGYPRKRTEVIAMVQQICDLRGLEVFVTHGWWERFCARHPKVSLRSASVLSHSRAMGACPEALNEYFDVYEYTLKKYNLEDKPGSLFNMDETGMPLDPKSWKVVVPKGMKNPSLITSGSKAKVTVVGCISAAGVPIPPMVVWDRKTLHPEMTRDEIPGTFYGLTSNGWMDMDLFENWLALHFLRYAPPTRPLLLLMDGHSSHYSPAAVRFAAEHEVILLTLPPNTTHVTQPLDKGCFGPLKVAWRDVCQRYITKNPGRVVTRMSFSPLFSAAWKQSMTMQNILAAFRVTGIYPVDRGKILPQSASPEPMASKLPYIPLLTPTPYEIQQRGHSPKFSLEEVELYLAGEHSEEERYKQWKKMYEHEYIDSRHPSLNDSVLLTPSKPGTSKPCVAVLVKPHSSLYQMFKPPSPLKPILKQTPRTSVRVLTSAENLKNIEEKERKKKEALEKKEKRKREREEKKGKKKQVNTSKL